MTLCTMCMHGTTSFWTCVCDERNCNHIWECGKCKRPRVRGNVATRHIHRKLEGEDKVMSKIEAVDPAQRFCESLPWGLDIRWFSKQGILPLPDSPKQVVFRLFTFGESADNYLGFSVQVRDVVTNTVALQHSFKFDEYIPKTMEARDDIRTDYRPRHGATCYYAWNHQGQFDWYIARPTKEYQERYCAKVREWIDLVTKGP